jgi:hypothetical protein
MGEIMANALHFVVDLNIHAPVLNRILDVCGPSETLAEPGCSLVDQGIRAGPTPHHD